MLTYVVWIAVSLAIAGAVFLVASVMERGDTADDEHGPRSFLRAFRSGLRRHHEPRQSRPVDTDMDAFFAANLEQAPGYVDAEEISTALHLAQVRVSTPGRGSPSAAGRARRER
ncbi:hypothetical protein [Isoptericola aurantiacus]|uniref:hypothetical protein n=1 Tax=Isoptericola aurantiacus TaxID=3377839 RepID=UPI00383AB3F2